MAIKKTGIIAIVIMFLMVGSTLAYSFLQSVRTPKTNQTSLPEKNIIDYELTLDQENTLIQNGVTVAKFSYSTSCIECLQYKSSLESLTNQFSNQMILEEISGNTDMSLTLTSLRNPSGIMLKNMTNDNIANALCKVLTQPPIGCAVRNV